MLSSFREWVWRFWKHQWLGNSRWHIGHDKRSSVHSVSISGSSWSWQGGLCHRVRRHFCLYECQRHFRKYFESSVLAIQRKRTSKCVFRNDSRDPLCSPKALQRVGKRVLCFCHFPHLCRSVYTMVFTGEEERERSKGDPRIGTRVVICANWSLQWIQLMCIDQKPLRMMMIIDHAF